MFRITAKYFNKEKNKVDDFQTFTDKPIKAYELKEFLKEFLKDQEVFEVNFEPVDELGNVVGKRGKKLI